MGEPPQHFALGTRHSRGECRQSPDCASPQRFFALRVAEQYALGLPSVARIIIDYLGKREKVKGKIDLLFIQAKDLI